MFSRKQSPLSIHLSSDNTHLSNSLRMLAPGSQHTFNIRSKGVRDAIISALLEKFNTDSIVKRIIKHLEMFDKRCLDKYCSFIIILEPLAKAELIFNTSRVDGQSMAYTLTSFNSTPPEIFTRPRRFLGLF